MRDRVKEGERLLKEKQRVEKGVSNEEKEGGQISHGTCVANPDSSISGSQPNKMGHGRMSDDYQITTAECALSPVASKADQSDSVSELESYQKMGCQ